MELAQAADQEIAAYEAAIAQIEAEKQRVAEQELKDFQKAQEEAKKRADAMVTLNQSINDQIESYERGEETESVKKMIKSGDFAQITSARKEQEQTAKSNKESYRDLLEQAANASTPEGKEFFLE